MNWSCLPKRHAGNRITPGRFAVTSTATFSRSGRVSGGPFVSCATREREAGRAGPDATLAERLTLSLDADPLPVPTEVRIGTVAALADSDRFDTATYIDVLKHIADDAEELTRVLRFIRPGGALVVLAPAHQWLFSPFDAAIGHYRRYTAKALANLRPAGGYLKSKFYLDSIGLLASIGNRLLLKSSMPTPGQIAIWDVHGAAVAWLDPLLGYRVARRSSASGLRTAISLASGAWSPTRRIGFSSMYSAMNGISDSMPGSSIRRRTICRARLGPHGLHF